MYGLFRDTILVSGTPATLAVADGRVGLIDPEWPHESCVSTAMRALGRTRQQTNLNTYETPRNHLPELPKAPHNTFWQFWQVLPGKS